MTAWRQKWYLVGWNPAVAHAAISLICTEVQSFTLPTWLGLEIDDRPWLTPRVLSEDCLNRPPTSKKLEEGEGVSSGLKTEMLWLPVPSYPPTSRPINTHLDFKSSFSICLHYYEPEPHAKGKVGRTQTEPGCQRSVA